MDMDKVTKMNETDQIIKKDDDSFNLGEIIRDGLRKKGLTQTDLANQLDIRPSSVSEWVRNRKITKWLDFIKVIQQLDIAHDIFPDLKAQQIEQLPEKSVNDLIKLAIGEKKYDELCKIQQQNGISLLHLVNLGVDIVLHFYDKKYHVPTDTLHELQKYCSINKTSKGRAVFDASEFFMELNKSEVAHKLKSICIENNLEFKKEVLNAISLFVRLHMESLTDSLKTLSAELKRSPAGITAHIIKLVLEEEFTKLEEEFSAVGKNI